MRAGTGSFMWGDQRMLDWIGDLEKRREQGSGDYQQRKEQVQGPEVGVCPRVQAQWGWLWDGAGCRRRKGSRKACEASTGPRRPLALTLGWQLWETLA